MSTYTQTLYQIVFSTKYREKTLEKECRTLIFKDIWGILKNKKSHVYRINGIEDHIHILVSLHPSIALSNLVKDIKLGSGHFIKENNILPNFKGWQDGYAAFTYAIQEKDKLIEYVKNQEQHHKHKSFQEELAELLQEHGIAFDENLLL
jgi:putative transposase